MNDGSSASPSKPGGSPLANATGLLSGTVLLGMAERLGERFIPLFMVQLGGGTLAVGLFQVATNLVGAAAALPGGLVADRIGSKLALQWFAAAATCGFVILALAGSWPVVILGALLAQSWSAISLPASLVLVTRAIRARNTAWGVSLHSLVRRVPMAIGPWIAGALMMTWGEERGLRVAFAIAVALGVATLVVQGLLLAPGLHAVDVGRVAPSFHPLRALKSMSRPLRELFVADVFIRFCEQIPAAFVVLWCLREIPHPVTALQFGQLTAIEMTVAMLVYLPGAWLSSRIGKPAAVVLTFVFFVAFPIVLLASRSFPALVIAFVLRGMKELGEPTRKSLILDLCPEESRATHFGGYYAVRDALAALAAGLGALIWDRSPAATLIAASAFGSVGVAWYAFAAWRSRGAAGPARI